MTAEFKPEDWAKSYASYFSSSLCFLLPIKTS